MRSYCFILLLLAAAGCELSPTTESGNFGSFLTGQVASFGGNTRGTNSIPAVKGEWTTQSDPNGVHVQLSGAKLGDVESLLQKAYGDPVTLDPDTGGLFESADADVAIGIFAEGNEVGVVCLPSTKSRITPDSVPESPDQNNGNDY